MSQVEQDRTDAEPQPWHALEASEVVEEMGSGDAGLSADEAAARLERHGPNELEADEPPSALQTLLEQFRSPLIYILVIAGIVTGVLGEYVDMGVIVAVLVLNAAIGFVQERRAESSIQALMQLAAPSAIVVRDGEEVELPARELVPGDLVVLRSGDRVPADVRLLRTTSMEVDESLLTGESTSVDKDPDPVDPDAVVAERSCLAFMGSNVAGGRGRGVIVATGMSTELGDIAEQVRGEAQPETPLQQRMKRFANLVAVVVVACGVLAVGVGLLMGMDVADIFLVAVALAVSAVPEGLPVAFTVALALGVRRMAAREAIIRRLPAVETLGSTTVIGSDKTGTLTANEMTVEELWAAGRHVDLREEEQPELDEALRQTLLAGVLTNGATWEPTDGGEEAGGDPTEVALLRSAARCGIDPARAREDHPVDADKPFEAARKFSATARTDSEGRHLIFVKGAPETVLDLCDDALTPEGPGELDHAAVQAEMEAMADDGLRVLAMASGTLEDPPGEEDDLEPKALTFLGLQGMMDPPRDGVGEAIAGCRDAGIRVVMITGDHARTARAIGGELGITTEGDEGVLTGAELEELDDDALREQVPDVSIYARVSPEHKLRIVHALQANGHVAAVTGDGVNDAPALKAAEIGIAMGASGTDVAKEASDMVLTDDDFGSIYAAVEEGRVTFDNVRKVTFFLVATGAAEILAIFTGLLAGLPLLLLPAQLLWLNLVTNGLQDVALAFEPGERGVLQRPPRKLSEGVLSRVLWERVGVVGVVMAALTVGLFAWTNGETDVTQARSVALSALVVFTAVQVLNSRAEHTSVFSMNPVANRFLTAAQIGALALHVGALYLPFTQFVLRVEPISLAAWGRIALLSLVVVAANELHKAIRRP